MKENVINIEKEPFIITFEGGDFVGKSFMVKYTKEFLSEMFPNKKIVVMREPGGTEAGEDIRNILFNRDLNDYSQILLYTASRSESYEKIIKPAIEEDAIVIMDRSLLSTFVYEESMARIIECSRPLIKQPFLLGTSKIMILLDTNNELVEKRIKERDQKDINKYDLLNQEEIRKKYKKAMLAVNKMDNFPLFNTGTILNMTEDTEDNKKKVKQYIIEQIERMERGEL